MSFKTIKYITVCIATTVLLTAPFASAHALELMSCMRPYESVDGSCQLIVTGETHGSYIHFKGQIQPSDYEFIKAKLSQRLKQPFGALAPEIWIESNGGDVNTAMQIGRLFRANNASVVANGTCASSCIFLLLGGVERNVIQDTLRPLQIRLQRQALEARVGVHRAYRASVAASETAKDIRASRVALKERVVKYLEEMDIAPELASLMDATPPEEMRFLSKQELVRYRITGRDPSDDERVTALLAQRYQITSAEYRTREVLRKSLCTRLLAINQYSEYSIREFVNCMERVMRTGR